MSTKQETLILYKNTEELKTCPFCKSTYIRLYGNGKNSYWCQCSSCLASTSTSDNKQKAVDIWNKLAEVLYMGENIDEHTKNLEKLCQPTGYIVTAEEITEILKKEN